MRLRDRVQVAGPVLDSNPNGGGRPTVAEGARPGAPSAATRRRHDRGRAVRRSLLVADVTALLVAFVVLQILFPAQSMNDRVGLDSEALVSAASLPLWVVLARAIGL